MPISSIKSAAFPLLSLQKKFRQFTLSQFGDKWSFIIIRDLMVKGRNDYHECIEPGKGMSTNRLATRLADLEKMASLINKKTH